MGDIVLKTLKLDKIILICYIGINVYHFKREDKVVERTLCVFILLFSQTDVVRREGMLPEVAIPFLLN